MSKKDMRKPLRDAIAPPAEPINVYCLHCGNSYSSDKIVWKEGSDSPMAKGAWCCPVNGCDSAGFGYDIVPDQTNRFRK